MTPGEIADWLDECHTFGVSRDASTGPRFSQAAATIRAQAEALKIATEALNSAAGVLSGEEMTKGSLIRALEQVNKALARIKEV